MRVFGHDLSQIFARHDAVDQAESRAVAASMVSPVSSISMACLRDTLRDSATIGVEQNRPILTPGVQKVAWSEAMARSQLATSWQPAAVASAVDLGDHRLRDA